MAQALPDLRPGFLRSPGGCIVQGSVLAGRYEWEKTVAPIESRPLLINRWNYEFVHRPAPDDYPSFGLGVFEYFQLCEAIGAALNSLSVLRLARRPLMRPAQAARAAQPFSCLRRTQANRYWGNRRGCQVSTAMPFCAKIARAATVSSSPTCTRMLFMLPKKITGSVCAVSSSGTYALIPQPSSNERMNSARSMVRQRATVVMCSM
jgi:hypothetical protein